jgi:hypothetical protein
MSATALDVHTRAAVLDGSPFGAAGAYEKVVGTLRFAVDPDHPLHTRVCDLDRAPRDGEGRATFAGDFYLLRPAPRAATAACCSTCRTGGARWRSAS